MSRPALRSGSLLSVVSRRAQKLSRSLCLDKCQSILDSCESCISQRSAAYGACGDDPTAQ